MHPNSRAVKFDIRNKINKQFGQFWSFLTRQWLEKGLASFKWHFWQNFRWQINNVWKFYISVSYIGSYYFTCISRKSSFAPNFSNLRVFLKFLIIQTKPNFSSPVKHCNFTPPQFSNMIIQTNLLFRRWFKNLDSTA